MWGRRLRFIRHRLRLLVADPKRPRRRVTGGKRVGEYLVQFNFCSSAFAAKSFAGAYVTGGVVRHGCGSWLEAYLDRSFFEVRRASSRFARGGPPGLTLKIVEFRSAPLPADT
jgi:hypothetical protein